MILSFDIDGPLLQDRTKGFFDFMQAQGLSCDFAVYAETGEWDLASPGLSHLERNVFYERFIAAHNGNWRDEPTHGARRALRALRGYHRHVVTTRGKQVELVTRQALDAHYGQFTGYHFGIAGKASKLQELSTRFFIEDNVREVLAASHLPGVQALLFPMKGVRRHVADASVIMLAAEDMVTPDMTDGRWHHVCCEAWKEITQIILSAARTAVRAAS